MEGRERPVGSGQAEDRREKKGMGGSAGPGGLEPGSLHAAGKRNVEGEGREVGLGRQAGKRSQKF